MSNRCSRPLSGAIVTLLGGLLLGMSSAPAEAGLFDALLGKTDASKEKAQPSRRQWNLQEYTAIRLAPREAGAPANEHPAELDGEFLRQQLAEVRLEGQPAGQTLFAADELAGLVGPLSEAFASAGSNDDVLLLSSARRSGAMLQQTAVTARMFVQGGRLQMIVHDTRQSYIEELRGAHVQPVFVYGSRSQASAAAVRGKTSEQKRADWLALATTAGAAPAQPAAAAPLVAPSQPAAAAPPVAPATQPPAAPRPRDPGFADDIEQRLLTLKRLRDKGLISEEEYQQKRREILQLL
jgi:Short C-terminal domain